MTRQDYNNLKTVFKELTNNHDALRIAFDEISDKYNSNVKSSSEWASSTGDKIVEKDARIAALVSENGRLKDKLITALSKVGANAIEKLGVASERLDDASDTLKSALGRIERQVS